MKWEHSDSIIAQRLSCHEIKGFFSKSIDISEDEYAFIENDGEISEEITGRKFKIRSIFSRTDCHLIIFDKKKKTLQRPLTDLVTKDRKKIDFSVMIDFHITGFNSFMQFFLKKRNFVSLEDVWFEIKLEVSSRVIGPLVSDCKLKDIHVTDECKKKLEGLAYRELEELFSKMGLNIDSFSATPVFSSDTIETEEQTIEDAYEEKKKREISSPEYDKEEAIALMQNERIRREAEIQLEREETQTDIEEALEALELKDIKDKQKLLNEINKMKRNIEPDESDKKKTIEKIQHQIEELRMQREMAEKKLYKREMSEDNFKKIADETEKKIIELQAKIEGLKS